MTSKIILWPLYTPTPHRVNPKPDPDTKKSGDGDLEMAAVKHLPPSPVSLGSISRTHVVKRDSQFPRDVL